MRSALLAAWVVGVCGGGPADVGLERPPAQWTVMLYVLADNPLERELAEDVREAAAVVLPGSVRVVAQVDRGGFWREPGGWIGVRRFVLGGGRGVSGADALPAPAGPIDSSRAEPLAEFVAWAGAAWPADRTALLVLGHGSRRVGNGAGEGGCCGFATGVGPDSSDADAYLSVGSVREALERAGAKVDLIGFSACGMARLENARCLAGVAEVMIASRGDEPARGWDHGAWARALAAEPGMGTRGLAGVIGRDYAASHAGGRRGETGRLSVVDLSRVEEVGAAVEALGEALARQPAGVRAVVRRARAAGADCGQGGAAAAVEVLAFARAIREDAAAPGPVRAAAAEVERCAPGAGEVSVYLPRTAAEFEETGGRRAVERAARAGAPPGWGGFLAWFHGPRRAAGGGQGASGPSTTKVVSAPTKEAFSTRSQTR